MATGNEKIKQMMLNQGQSEEGYAPNNFAQNVVRTGAEISGKDVYSASDIASMQEDGLQNMQLLKVMEDGTELYKLQDGGYSVANKELGVSTQNPEIVQKVMKGELLTDITGYQKSKMAYEVDPAAAYAAKYLQETPFVGSYFDEVGEIIGSEQMKRVPELAKAAEDIDPAGATATGITSSILGGFGAAGLVKKPGSDLFDYVSKLPVAKKWASLMGIGGAAGGIEGVTYGLGEQQGEGRLANAYEKGLTNAATGIVATPLVAAAGKGFAALKQAWKGKDSVAKTTNNLAQDLGVSVASAKIISKYIDADASIEEMIAGIKRAGDQGMIADADMTMSRMLDNLASLNADSAKIITPAVEQRAVQAGQESARAADKTIAPMQYSVAKTTTGEEIPVSYDFNEFNDQIKKLTAEQRNQAYQKYYTTPINYASPEGFKIESVLKEVPNDIKDIAIRVANQEMRKDNVLEATRQIQATIDDKGDIVFSELPNALQLDYIKRAIGDVAYNTSKFNTAFDEQKIKLLKNTYTELNDLIGKASPAYRTAVELGQDNIFNQQSFDLGTKIFADKLEPIQLNRQFKKMSPSQQQFAKFGFRSEVQRIIDNAKGTLTGSQEDITGLRQLINKLSSKKTKTKAQIMLGSDKYKELEGQFDRLRAALELKADIAVNSKTAQRSRFSEDISEQVMPTIGESLSRGSPKAVQQIKDEMFGSMEELTADKQRLITKELSKLLTESRGTEAVVKLKSIYNAAVKNKMTQAEADELSRIFMNNVQLPAIFGATEAVENYKPEE